MSVPIKVVLRLRPSAPSSSFTVRPNGFTVASPGKLTTSKNALESHTLEGVTVLGVSASQVDCYNSLAHDLIEQAVEGVSGCVLAYGQTGSGKTHSMLGAGSFESRGIIPRALAHVFSLLEDAAARGDAGRGGASSGGGSVGGVGGGAAPTVRLSYVEILETGIVDLLARLPDFSGVSKAVPAVGGGAEEAAAAASAAARSADAIVKPLSSAAAASGAAAGGGALLAVAEDRSGRTYIPGLLMPRVASEAEARHLLLEGNTNRAIAEHALNKASSRSHAVLTLYIEQQHAVEDPGAPGRYVTVASRLHLVDLAGSERVQKTHAEGARLREANFINKSLSALEAVVIALGEVQAGGGGGAAAAATALSATGGGSSAGLEGAGAQQREHVPYRSSRLTHLLKGALGGGSGSTRLLATIWPEDLHSEECVATMRFAGRMMNLRTRPSKEIVSRSGALDVEERNRLMAMHAAEVNLLRRELAMHDILSGRGRDTTQHAPLSAGEVGVIRDLMEKFCAGEFSAGSSSSSSSTTGSSSGALFDGGGGSGVLVGGALSTVRHIEEAFEVLRRALWEARGSSSSGEGSADGVGQVPGGGGGGGGGAASFPAGQEISRVGGAGQRSDGGGGAESQGEILEAWRLTSPEYAAFVEARKIVKEVRARYAAAALRVNEAKRAVDAALAEAQQEQNVAALGPQSTFVATRLVEAKAAYRAKYDAATAVRAEAEYNQSHVDALSKVVAGAFQIYLRAR